MADKELRPAIQVWPHPPVYETPRPQVPPPPAPLPIYRPVVRPPLTKKG